MIGSTVSHYKILEKLGGGGMGVVYKAEDTKLKRTVALKFLPLDMTQDPEAKQRFTKEAQTASSLDHPNICTIYEVDETEDGRLFISMAFYKGETLKRKIKRGPLNLQEAINITTQVAQGLAKAHSKRIVHRDIKPENIFITEDGEVKILDFGLAKLAGETRITKTGTAVGTVAYMSPEQIHGNKINHQTDIWSLGVVLYEMLTGRLPFKGKHWEELIYLIFKETPQLMKQLRHDVPEQLDQVVTKMLNKDIRDRYHDTTTLITDLKTIDLSTYAPAVPQPLYAKVAQILNRREPQRIIISVLAVTVLIIAFFFTQPLLFRGTTEMRRKPIAVMTFKNLTGESSLGYLSEAIPNLLITNLEQSENFAVMTWERMHDLLKTMGKEDAEIINEELGFELCRMDGIKTIVLGSYTKAGDIFATDVKVLDVKTKKLLRSASSRGEGISSILQNQIDELSIDISRSVGISEEKIEVAQPRVVDVTSTSMEAYNYFLRGRDDFEKKYYDDARKFLEKAVEIDSMFAVAYLYLAETYHSLENFIQRDKAYEKAKAFSKRATEKDRLYIEEGYASTVEEDTEKSLRILKHMAVRYPKEKRAHYSLATHYWHSELYDESIAELTKTLKLDPNYGSAISLLAYCYLWKKEYNRAIEYYSRYALLSPGDADPFDSMGELYFRTGKLDEALSKYEEALEVKPDFGSEWKIAYVYALKEDYTEAINWVDRYIDRAPSPGLKALGYTWKAFYSFWQGRYDECLSHMRLAIDLGEPLGELWYRAAFDWLKGTIHYELGEFELSRSCYENSLNLHIKNTPQDSLYHIAHLNYEFGLLDLKEGKIDPAKSRLAVMPTHQPKYDSWYDEHLVFVRVLFYGEILLAQDSLEQAIAVCREASTSIPSMWHGYLIDYNLPLMQDILARAYHRKGEIDKAISEYEQLATFNPMIQDRRLIHPKYHYRLAKVYEEKGQKLKAIQQYEKFLELWENADEHLPEPIDARERLKKLLGKLG